jgi:predicted Zn-dependent protease
MRRFAWFALLAVACATNPVTGKRQLSLVSEGQEIEMGKQAAQEIGATMPKLNDPKVQAYVEAIGKRMAAASERPNLPWTFTVLDDSTVNAFALPGGPVFITRGILTHMNSEAELASVMGHEIGHITARHSVDQISKAQLAQVGLVAGMVVRPELAGLAQAAGAGLQLLFLKYGRDHERQSDELGFKYMLAQGYDVREMDDMFTTLDRTSQAAGGRGMPEWASTHPNPENRAETAQARAAKVEPAKLAQLRTGRDEFLALLNGMSYGDDPRQGYFKGNAFLHPELRFQLQFPEGWQKQNTPTAVVAGPPSQDAMIQLQVAGKMSPEEARTKFFSQQGIQAAQASQGGALPANASYFAAKTQQGELHGLVRFVGHGGTTFMLLGVAPAGKLGAHDAAIRQALASFGPLTDPQALAVQPAKIELVKVPREMSVAEFHAQFPSTVPAEQIAIINGLDPKSGRFAAGRTAKRVTGGVPANQLK